MAGKTPESPTEHGVNRRVAIRRGIEFITGLAVFPSFLSLDACDTSGNTPKSKEQVDAESLMQQALATAFIPLASELTNAIGTADWDTAANLTGVTLHVLQQAANNIPGVTDQNPKTPHDVVRTYNTLDAAEFYIPGDHAPHELQQNQAIALTTAGLGSNLDLKDTIAAFNNAAKAIDSAPGPTKFGENQSLADALSATNREDLATQVVSVEQMFSEGLDAVIQDLQGWAEYANGNSEAVFDLIAFNPGIMVLAGKLRLANKKQGSFRDGITRNAETFYNDLNLDNNDTTTPAILALATEFADTTVTNIETAYNAFDSQVNDSASVLMLTLASAINHLNSSRVMYMFNYAKNAQSLSENQAAKLTLATIAQDAINNHVLPPSIANVVGSGGFNFVVFEAWYNFYFNPNTLPNK